MGDVQRYLDRVDFKDVGQPTLGQVCRLHERHLLAVPFENLDIHRGVEIVLDEERILTKIVEQRRGGFCYELNTAFGWLLRQLDYRVTWLSAEVARKEGGFGIPFDHMTLRVDLDQPWLADVGFGDGFRQPLPLGVGKPVEQLGDIYRLRTEDSWWIVERRRPPDPGFEAQYRFTLEPRRLADYAPGCKYHQTSPRSSFTRAPICTLALPDGRVTLHPDRLATTRLGARTEMPVSDLDQWVALLKTQFGIGI